MDTRNLLTITNSNLRLNIKQTFFPAILLLFVIPLIYGTSKQDQIEYIFDQDNYRSIGVGWHDGFQFCGAYSARHKCSASPTGRSRTPWRG